MFAPCVVDCERDSAPGKETDMRVRLERRQLWLAILLATPAAAQINTDRGVSLLVFPKVIVDSTTDTLIQVTNNTSNQRHAHCFYTNRAAENPSLPPGPDNPPRLVDYDFDLWLTKQQPTHWLASSGRFDDPTDETCRITTCEAGKSGGFNGVADCCDAGFDGGRIPPLTPIFYGELRCVEVDASGFPVPGNALIGKATLTDRPSGAVRTYSALGLSGFDTNNMDATLCVGGPVSAGCPSGPEYQACPDRWIVNHLSGDSTDLVAAGSRTDTRVTVSPCTLDYTAHTAQPLTLLFLVINAFEERFSASTQIERWADVSLSEISDVFLQRTLGTPYAQTEIRGISSDGIPSRGIFVVAQTNRSSDSGSAADMLHVVSAGIQPANDIIRIPAERGGN
jgi:hypothetical protein